MDSLLSDIRFTARTWLRNPGFTAVADPHTRAWDRREHDDVLGRERDAPPISAVSARGTADDDLERSGQQPRPLNIVSLPNYRD